MRQNFVKNCAGIEQTHRPLLQSIKWTVITQRFLHNFWRSFDAITFSVSGPLAVFLMKEMCFYGQFCSIARSQHFFSRKTVSTQLKKQHFMPAFYFTGRQLVINWRSSILWHDCADYVKLNRLKLSEIKMDVVISWFGHRHYLNNNVRGDYNDNKMLIIVMTIIMIILSKVIVMTK